MKTPSQDLFNLIHSMSQTEKRYFKIFATSHSKGKKSKYVTLFEIIDNQKSYDENKIRKQLGDDPVTRQFNVAKKYLYEQILRSLRIYHDKLTVRNELKSTIQNVEILYKKGLYTQAINILKKAEEKAILYDYPTSLLEILRLKRVMDSRFSPSTQREDEETTYAKVNRLLIDLGMENEMSYLNVKTHHFIKNKVLARDKKALKELKKEISDVRSKIDQTDGNFYTKMLGFNTLHLYNSLAHNYDASFENAKQLVELFHNNTHHIEEDYQNYHVVVINYIIAAVWMEDTEAIDWAVEHLEKINESGIKVSDKFLADQFLQVSSARIAVWNKKGQQQKSREFIETLKDKHLPHMGKTKSSYEWTYFFMIAKTYFDLEEYGIAAKWINRILRDKYADTQNTYIVFSRILNVILHYEMNNEELALSQARSAQRLFSKHITNKDYFQFEKIITNYIIKSITTKTPKAEIRASFKKQLSNFLESSDYKKQLDQFINLDSWIDKG